MIRLVLAILAGKFTAFLIRTFTQSGGSAAPGLVALYIDPQLIRKFAKQIPQNIVVTGTNGKTTTSAMIANILVHREVSILHNGTGSNLSRGVASKLLSKSSIFGKITNVALGVWEADEAAFVDIISQVKPEHIVILNIFRDQLDRYGEINTIINKWMKALEKATWSKTVYLNGDDGHLENFKKYSNTQIQTFGIAQSPVHFEKKSSRVNFDIKAQILSTDIDGTEIVFGHKGFGQKTLLPIIGIYNVYNFLPAYLVARELEFSVEDILGSLSSFKPAFGRMEKVLLNNRHGLIALIKNPAGTTQVLETINPMIRKEDVLVIILNDNIADGTDVSWIWDAHFEKILENFSEIFVTGTRRYDMALRLVYAGIKKENVNIYDNLEKTMSKLSNRPNSGRVFILPTYTALLELQEYLTENGYKDEQWHKEVDL